MWTPIAALWGIEWLFWWQIPLLVLLIILLIIWKVYRSKQM
jgi:hypothetical protein